MPESHDAKATMNDACEVALRAFLIAQVEALDAIGHGDIRYADEARDCLRRLRVRWGRPSPPAPPPPGRSRAAGGHLRLLGPLQDDGWAPAP